MYVKEVTVENQVGLHARPATFFIQKANEFKMCIRDRQSPDRHTAVPSARRRQHSRAAPRWGRR